METTGSVLITLGGSDVKDFVVSGGRRTRRNRCATPEGLRMRGDAKLLLAKDQTSAPRVACYIIGALAEDGGKLPGGTPVAFLFRSRSRRRRPPKQPGQSASRVAQTGCPGVLPVPIRDEYGAPPKAEAAGPIRKWAT